MYKYKHNRSIIELLNSIIVEFFNHNPLKPTEEGLSVFSFSMFIFPP